MRVIKPENSGSLFYNYKHYFSIVLQAVYDAQYCFTAVDIGSYGKSSDSSIFQSSEFSYKLKNRLLGIPDPETLEPEVPYVFVGDEAFGLSQHMMRPYAGKSLTLNKRVFNYRPCRARRFLSALLVYSLINGGSFIDLRMCRWNSLQVLLRVRSRGSSVSIVSDYGLDDRGSIPDRSRGFFL
jgi:hypothetical protein